MAEPWARRVHCAVAERQMPMSLWLVTLVQRWLLPVMLQVLMGEVSTFQSSAPVPFHCRAEVLLANTAADYFQAWGSKLLPDVVVGGMKAGSSLLGV